MLQGQRLEVDYSSKHLYINSAENSGASVVALLVLKDNVRKPNGLAWDTNDCDAVVFRFIPGESIISPLLWKTFSCPHKFQYLKIATMTENIESKLTISIHTLVVRVSSFSFCGTSEDCVS